MHAARIIAIVLLQGCWCAAAAQSKGNWSTDLKEWRTQHAEQLQKPDGWLSLVGLEWLQPGETRVGSAPGNNIVLPTGPAQLAVLHLEGDTVAISPPAGGFPADLLIDGRPASARTLPTGTTSDKENPRLKIGSLLLYVIKRSERYALRVKDSKSPALSAFHGLKWFAPDARYRITARWVPYDSPKKTTFTTLVGTSYSQAVPGVAEFTLAGKRYRLEPVIEEPNDDHPDTKLFFIIRDMTSKTTTYGACRFLYTSFPTGGLEKPGELVLDFNKLENPPCAYTSFATCPLPPPGNRLPVSIPAGEKRYHN